MRIISEKILLDGFEFNIHKILFYQIKDFIYEFDEHIHKIANGIVTRDKKKIYQRLQRFFEQQTKTTIQGAIAELFCHIVLNTIGLNQASLFFNLEENSIKKGFDGLYLKDNDIWLMESKSSINSSQIHIANHKLAVLDLKGKLKGTVKNNPWENALKHYVMSIESRDDNIMNRITRLSDEFEDKIEGSTNDFNIIPASTLFTSDNMPTVKEITGWLKLEKDKFKNILILCINNKLLDDFQK